jgi:uncharacterized MAPEG superfamily protein
MNSTILALIGYISWTMLVLICLEAYRTVQVMKEKRAPNSFNTDGSDVTPFGQRLTRTLGNCIESFPLIGGTMLLALATGASAITDGLALYLLIARLGQSIVHLISTSELAVQVRFVFFVVQQVIVIYWLFLLFTKFVG